MLLQWIGFVIGTIGMILWALNTSWSKWAGIFWIIASACWVYVGWEQSSPALMMRDIINMIIFAVGIWRWVFPPA